MSDVPSLSDTYTRAQARPSATPRPGATAPCRGTPVPNSGDPFSAKEWDRHCARVAWEMIENVGRFSTPISLSLYADQVGKHLGTGSYHDVLGVRLLLTCEHVLRHRGANNLAHRLLGHDPYVVLNGVSSGTEGTIDAAIALISADKWGDIRHASQAVPLSRWDIAHRPVASELFFVHGYALENSQFIYDDVRTDGAAYVCLQASLPAHRDIDDRFHFALEYRRDAAKPAFGDRGLPDPHAMSGSLVWNTRFVEAGLAGRKWLPSDAVVTGLLWSWPEGRCIVATRIEYVRAFVLSALDSWSRAVSGS